MNLNEKVNGKRNGVSRLGAGRVLVFGLLPWRLEFGCGVLGLGDLDSGLVCLGLGA